MRSLVGFFIGLTLFVASPVQALLIDFTDDLWSDADSATSVTHSYDGLDVTVSSGSDSQLLTFNSPGPSSPDFLARDGDGLGIIDDEISYADDQLINIAFSQSVTVVAYYFLDLFANEGPDGEAESAQVVFHRAGGIDDTFSDFGFATDRVGFYSRESIEISAFDSISFTALNGRYSDYALAGIEIRSPGVVPLPGALVLFLTGLGFLGIKGSRRRSQTLHS